jgi:hypothetical protein
VNPGVSLSFVAAFDVGPQLRFPMYHVLWLLLISLVAIIILSLTAHVPERLLSDEHLPTCAAACSQVTV